MQHIDGLIGGALANERLNNHELSATSGTRLIYHCDNFSGFINGTRPSQRTRHLRQSPRTHLGFLDPPGCVEGLIGQARPGQRTRRLHQSPRTHLGFLDPPGWC